MPKAKRKSRLKKAREAASSFDAVTSYVPQPEDVLPTADIAMADPPALDLSSSSAMDLGPPAAAAAAAAPERKSDTGFHPNHVAPTHRNARGKQKLPPRVTSAMATREYDGPADQDKFGRVLEAGSRKSLGGRHTREMRGMTEDDLENGDGVTPQARSMADNPDESLTAMGAERNHGMSASYALMAASSMAATVTDHGTDQKQRSGATDAFMSLAGALTGDDEEAIARIQAQIDELDSDDDTVAAAACASSVASGAADHANNLGFGDPRQNRRQSSRHDPTTSADGLSLTRGSVEASRAASPGFHALMGDPLAEQMLAVPQSPTSGMYVSSKALEDSDDE